MSAAPRDLLRGLEAGAPVPPGAGERFNGYGVMGLPFSSGHVLAQRRFPGSSVGPGYSSVWHRGPHGSWTMYVDESPRLSCPRFFGAAVSRVIRTGIRTTWPEPWLLRIEMPEVPFAWDLRLAVTPATRFMNAVASLVPEPVWRSPSGLSMMEKVAGPILGVERVAMHGTAPSGQRFMANPRRMWMIAESRAVLAGEDLGPPGPVRPQARLGEFWIPQRGILALGQSFFDAYDPGRHRPLPGDPAVAAG